MQKGILLKMRGKKILALALTASLSLCNYVYAEGDLDFSDEVGDDVYEEPSFVETSPSPAPSSGEVEYEYVPPKIEVGGKSEGSFKWQNLYPGLNTYSPTIKINKDDFFDSDFTSEDLETEIYEQSNVFFTNENGVKIPLGVRTQNEKVRFGSEKQIYEKIFEEIQKENDEIWWMDAGDKCILSYGGKLLISYASGEKSYSEVSSLFSTFGKGAISFEKM